MKHYPFLTINCLAYIVLWEKNQNASSKYICCQILLNTTKICEHRLLLLISYQPLPSSLTNINVICKFDFFSAENVHVLCTSSFPLKVATGIRTNA